MISGIGLRDIGEDFEVYEAVRNNEEDFHMQGALRRRS